MSLPDGFVFTQSNLEDYRACPRRFELRYIQRQAWPAVESEPVREQEWRMQQGAAFHRMVQQHIIGVPLDALDALATEEPLRSWWAAYLHHRPVDLPAQQHAELMLSTPLVTGRGSFRLLAKFDLIAVAPGERLVIVDWKTAQRITPAERLRHAMQTRVYRYVLAEAGAHLNGGEPPAPEQISLRYWFAEAPDATPTFPYHAAEHAQTRADLIALAEEIAGRERFDLTADVTRCRYCAYRSLCDRGIEAGAGDGEAFGEAFTEAEAGAAFDLSGLTLDQIGETAF